MSYKEHIKFREQVWKDHDRNCKISKVTDEEDDEIINVFIEENEDKGEEENDEL